MGTQTLSGRKQREKEHFEGIGIYLLNFLNECGTESQRTQRTHLLKCWDKHFQYIPESLYKDRVVLDACCGNPRNVAFFKARGAKTAVGCDISMKIMRRGLERDSTCVYDAEFEVDARGTNCVQGDSESLPFKDESIDTVFCFQSLHHLVKENFLAEAARVLRGGGALFISDPNGSHPLRGLADYVGRKAKVLTWDERSMEPSSISELIEKQGFEIESRHFLNFLSETYFLLTAIVGESTPRLMRFLRRAMPFFNFLDGILERTLFPALPSLSWRMVFVARKKYSPVIKEIPTLVS
ncbi:MAG: methyltransferase domain-containing protein [bacterium]